jgi:hypothetical protein
MENKIKEARDVKVGDDVIYESKTIEFLLLGDERRSFIKSDNGDGTFTISTEMSGFSNLEKKINKNNVFNKNSKELIGSFLGFKRNESKKLQENAGDYPKERDRIKNLTLEEFIKQSKVGAIN